VSRAALKAFMDHSWPGNVRELANAVEHAFVLCSGRELEVSDLPAEIRHAVGETRSMARQPVRSELPGKALSRNTLITLLRDSAWNKAEVARRTGLSRASVWKYMKKWDIPQNHPGESVPKG
jgi:transcriptional regulator of acetoin/glycerol metabolism